MENLIKTKAFHNECKKMRKDINNSIISLFEKHNKTKVYCGELCDCPTIFEGITDDDTITLDAIENTKYGIIFEGSGCYQNGDKHIDGIDIELLVWIYDWLLDNEEEVFEEE